jgi:hypothetical protein
MFLNKMASSSEFCAWFAKRQFPEYTPKAPPRRKHGAAPAPALQPPNKGGFDKV